MSDFIVAVTGGVASGKSTVTRRLEALGVPVFDADVVARDLVQPGQPALDAIVARFGAEVLDAEGALDRARMREKVFSDPSARRELEGILHPRIRAGLQQLCREAVAPYVVVAIPLLAEGGGRDAYPWLDRIVVVDAPDAARRERLLQRDGIEPALAEKMMAAQAGRSERLALADEVLTNAGDIAALHAAVDALDARIRAAVAAQGRGSKKDTC